MSQEKMPEDFDSYRFIEKLGSGAASEVYLAEDTALKRRVVIRTWQQDPGSMAARDPSRSLNSLQPVSSSAATRDADLQREIRTLAQLDNAHIPRLHGSGRLRDGRSFVVMDYVEGADLGDILDRAGKLGTEETLVVARAIADALAYAHARSIVHLDVKPSNILVPGSAGRYRFGDAKLIDFGVFRELQAGTNLTRAGSVLGTPYYMSPEQLLGKALTPAADVFGLGAVMFEMLSGCKPFGNVGDAPEKLFTTLLYGKPAELPESIPLNLRKLVEQCLDKDPERRPATGGELLAALVRLADGGSLLDGIASEGRLGADAGRSAGSVSRPAASAVRASSSSGVYLGLVILALVVAVLLALKFMVRSGAESGGPNAGFSHSADWWLADVGLVLIVAAIPLGMFLRRYLRERGGRVAAEVNSVLSRTPGANRDALSLTLSVQVDELMEKCSLVDEKMMGATIAVMVHEYHAGKTFDDRQKALMNAISILEKLRPKLSPWYVRYEKLIAATVSIVTILSGLAAAAQGFVKLTTGKP